MNERPINVGVIGYGYWGPNLVRNFVSSDDSTVTMVADCDLGKLKQLAKLFPAVRRTQDAEELLSNPDVDAVAIATPVSSHFELARAALLSGKHVLVEKPITAKSEQAEELIAIARHKRLVLMVDHTFVYTGAVRKIREMIDSGELGDLYYFDSTRINLGLLQPDINVLWDLAPHDLSILLYLFDENPTAVQAIGYSHIGPHEEMAQLNLEYESGFHAHIRTSWLSPVKMRLTIVGGHKKMIVYDDIDPSDKIKVYDKGIVVDLTGEDVTTNKPIYRAGDVFIPKLDRAEALQVETAHFVDCIRRDLNPLTDGQKGLDVVRILEAADQSLKSNGEFVSLTNHERKL